LVNELLTLFSKVNVLEAAESQFEQPGCEMNKNLPARWSFWTWLLGGGTTNGGSGG
jgi:hypothetical protein